MVCMETLEHNSACVREKRGGGGWYSLDVVLRVARLSDRTRASFKPLMDVWFNSHIPTFVYMCVLTRDRWVSTGEHVCVFEREPGKGEGPRVNGQKQLLSCARETSARERERKERTARVQVSIWVAPWVRIAAGTSLIRCPWEGLWGGREQNPEEAWDWPRWVPYGDVYWSWVWWMWIWVLQLLELMLMVVLKFMCRAWVCWCCNVEVL